MALCSRERKWGAQEIETTVRKLLKGLLMRVSSLEGAPDDGVCLEDMEDMSLEGQSANGFLNPYGPARFKADKQMQYC